jgi:hypothetical protein
MAILCKFYFTRGACRNGTSCKFSHQVDTSSENEPRPISLPWRESLQPDTFQPHQFEGLSGQVSGDTRGTIPCKFLTLPGGCRKVSCPFLHVVDGLKADDRSSQTLESTETNANSFRAPFDARSLVACKFFASPSGCRNDSCPFLHVANGQEARDNIATDMDLHDNEVGSYALVSFRTMLTTK